MTTAIGSPRFLISRATSLFNAPYPISTLRRDPNTMACIQTRSLLQSGTKTSRISVRNISSTARKQANCNAIRKKFKTHRPQDNRILTLLIPDDYERGDPMLIALLREKAREQIAQMRDRAAEA